MSGARVYVGGLPYDVRERDLERFFKGYGRITEILIKKGYGFVEFEDYRDADDAVYEMNGKKLLGERVTIEPARGTARGSGGRRERERRGARSRYGPPLRTKHRLIVENLSSRISWQDLKDYMRQAGEVTYADAHRDRKNEGVVEFATSSEMKAAIKQLDDTELNGRRIRLQEDRGGRSGGGRGGRSRSRSDSRSRSPSRRRSRSGSRRSSRSRSRSKSRSLSKNGRKSRSLKRDRDVSRSRSREVDNKSKSRSKSRVRDDRRSRSRSRSKVEKSRSRSVSRSRSKDKKPERSPSHDRVDRSRSRSRSRSKSKDARSRSRSRSYSRSRSRSRDSRSRSPADKRGRSRSASAGNNDKSLED